MRSLPRVMTLAPLMVLFACQSNVGIHTMSAPDVALSNFRTFRILPGPEGRVVLPPTRAEDPMIGNSIANRAIREQIANAFQERGYMTDERSPDIAVAFYATAREKLDIVNWDYGYPFVPGWSRYPHASVTAVQYDEGSVVIDVIRPRTRELLWRGEAKAELTGDPAENVRQLAKAAAAIVAKFPEARREVVVTDK